MPIVPGYLGFVPPDQRQVMPLKSGVSQRLPLAHRAKQAAEASVRVRGGTPDATAAPAPRSYFIPKRHTEPTTYGEATQAYVRSPADVPPRCNERSFMPETVGMAHARFDGTTTTKAATLGYVGPEDPAFYSRIRVQERIDDDQRHSLEESKTRSGAAKNLRCSAIQTKREFDPAFAPEPIRFARVERTRPAPTAAERPARSHSAAPALGGNSTGAYSGKANLLVAGSTQTLDYRDPRELAASASTTLHESLGRSALAPDRALVAAASGRDLFAGTGKAPADVCSGYMGHVPANPGNVAKVHGAGDPLRAHAKTFVTVTAPTGNSTTSLLRAKLAAAQLAAERVSGHLSLPKTVGATFLQTAATAADERRMNRVEAGRQKGVREFFTRGVGDQDDLVADQFCMRFRPLEGAMRHGAPSTHTWISEAELRRSPRL